LRELPAFSTPDLLIGAATSDDAAVYRIDAERALVQTVDFFTPIVDDPFLYGQIAATNSLSDVYAMGGRPITAMNLLAVPDEVPLEMANTILRGGAEKVKEAQCALAGGHSVKAPEPFYGLSVTGVVHPDKVISNAGAKPGDLLLLTKPLGTGIISTALKRKLCGEDLLQIAVRSMSTLNLPGADIAEQGLCKAGTDVTGFGLLGHLGSMAKASGVTAVVYAGKIPVLDEQVLALIASGVVPGGTKANLKHAEGFTHFASQVSASQRLLLSDAQTSGGLLLAVSPQHLDAVLAICAQHQTLCATVIGHIEQAQPAARVMAK
jgi:selenide,water dikinase